LHGPAHGAKGCHGPIIDPESVYDRRREACRVSTHALFVTAAYAITAIVLAGLIGWILLDQRARRRELAELEASGLRRRSDKAPRP
jgi:heme exporter protein D